jgi:membrane protease YdiL (CAAX protease family)
MALGVRPLPRAALLLAGLGAAMALRLAAAPNSGLGGLVFTGALLLLAAAAGWRPGRLQPGPAGVGLLGAAGLILIPAWRRWAGDVPPLAFPADQLLSWALVIGAVAVAEELLLRGVLFSLLEEAAGAWAAMGVTALAFALLHVPLYGWGAVPLDLAVGVWLGGLRVLTGGVTAPAVAHTVADLAGWWLL